jgi:hypothetical protein
MLHICFIGVHWRLPYLDTRRLIDSMRGCDSSNREIQEIAPFFGILVSERF